MSMPSDFNKVWQGRYSDGTSASSGVADVRLSDRGVEIGFPGAPQALVWPYGALTVAAPIRKQAPDVLVGYTYMPGATLFVADADFVQALAKAAPKLTSSSYAWRSARPWIAVAALIGIVAIVLGYIDFSPSRWLARLMPDSLRTTIGQQVIQSMTSQYKPCTAPAGVAALDRLTKRLSTAAGGNTKFDVKVVDWNLLNAFAAPGEQIVLTRRIIQDAKGPDEIAGVLAHEMGHGIHLHPESSIIRVIGLSAAIEIMMGGGGGTLANIGLLLTQLSYTREGEREADTTGLKLLRTAQISPAGVVSFFERLEKQEGGKSSGSTPAVLDILRSHPRSAERAKEAAKGGSYPSTPALSAEDWQALRAICQTAEKPAEKK